VLSLRNIPGHCIDQILADDFASVPEKPFVRSIFASITALMIDEQVALHYSLGGFQRRFDIFWMDEFDPGAARSSASVLPRVFSQAGFHCLK